jgi:phage shock protein A
VSARTCKSFVKPAGDVLPNPVYSRCIGFPILLSSITNKENIMALITRVSRLFRADVHAVLDRIEEPATLLKQAIREMEEDVAREERRLKVLAHEHGQLVTRESELDHSLRETEEELDVCFASGKDELARALIKRKLEGQRFRTFLLRKREMLEATISKLRRRLEENRSRLDSMRQKAELLSQDEGPGCSEEPWSMSNVAVREEDVEVAFLREKQKRSRS